MGIQENKALVMLGYKHFKEGNIQGVLDTYADDIEWVGNKLEGVPFSGTYRGKEGAAEYFKKVHEATERLQFEPIELIAEGNKVVVTGHSTRKVRTTGITYSIPWVHVITLRDGKIARFEIHDNSVAIASAFSLKPV